MTIQMCLGKDASVCRERTTIQLLKEEISMKVEDRDQAEQLLDPDIRIMFASIAKNMDTFTKTALIKINIDHISMKMELESIN